MTNIKENISHSKKSPNKKKTKQKTATKKQKYWWIFATKGVVEFIIPINSYPFLFQVFYVIVQFGGLLPESVLIQRRKLDLLQREPDNMTEQSWLDWQYMARNCSVFNMQNNGPLPRPDSVNCLQLPRLVRLFWPTAKESHVYNSDSFWDWLGYLGKR